MMRQVTQRVGDEEFHWSKQQVTGRGTHSWSSATINYEFVSEATYIQLEGVDSAGAAWRLYWIRMNWNGMMIRVVWWEGTGTVGGRTATCVRLLQRCAWLQQADRLCYITMQVKIGFSFFPSYFGHWLCGDGNSIACVSTTMSQCIHLHWNSYFLNFIFNPKQFFLFLIWRYSLHCISYFGCSKHHVKFSLMLHVTIILMYFTLVVPSLCILPLFWLSC
jgi:hypothetical protein